MYSPSTGVSDHVLKVFIFKKQVEKYWVKAWDLGL